MYFTQNELLYIMDTLPVGFYPKIQSSSDDILLKTIYWSWRMRGRCAGALVRFRRRELHFLVSSSPKCFYVNQGCCNDVTILSKSCSPDLCENCNPSPPLKLIVNRICPSQEQSVIPCLSSSGPVKIGWPH